MFCICLSFQIKSPYILYAENYSFCSVPVFFFFSIYTTLFQPRSVSDSSYFYGFSTHLLKNIIWNNFSLWNICRNNTKNCIPHTLRAPFMFCQLPCESIQDLAMYQFLCFSSFLVLHLSLTFITLTFLKTWASYFVEYPSIYICLIFPHV